MSHSSRRFRHPASSALRFGILLFVLAAVGSWLTYDFHREKARIVEETSTLAMHKSRLISRAFGDTFQAADYVLRDLLGRVDLDRDPALAHRDPATARRLDGLLKEKALTVPGVHDLVLLDGDCIFAATATRPLRGTRSNQRFCARGSVAPGQHLHIQYMPPEKSASRRPVVLMSRTVGDPDGRLRGAAMAVVDLEPAQQWITALETDPSEVHAIVDSDGILLARTPPMREAIGKPTAPPPNQRAFREIETTATYVARSPLDGEERVFGLAKVERLPFVAIVGYGTDHILRGWRFRAWQFAIGFALISVLALWLLRTHLEVVRQHDIMHRLAITDTLTGVANRRHILEIGDRELARARRHGKPFSVLMLDIDRFKRVNDTWGHAAGDRVIQEFSRLLATVVRGEDAVGRLGGEEFAVLLPETDLAGAAVIAERLRIAIEATERVIAEEGAVVRFTTSIGIAEATEGERSFDAILNRADKALYQAKAKGRNLVATAGQE